MPEFIAGQENRLAFTAVSAALDGNAHGFSPLVLYGPSGSGKSHLARGLADAWRGKSATAQVVCMSGAEFAAAHHAALERQERAAWRDSMTSASHFVLDDLGQLLGRRPAQHELRSLLDVLKEQRVLVLVTAAVLPAQMIGLAAGLRGRLAEGLSVPLHLPAAATRQTILERLARLRGLTLSKPAARALLESNPATVSSIAGALVQLEMLAQQTARPVDAEFVRSYLAERRRQAAPTLREIAAATARQFGLSVAELKSPWRRQSLVAARGVVVYLARQLTEKSLEQIGQFLGGRDHTTVLHAYRRTEKAVKRDPPLAQLVGELRGLLTAADPLGKTC